MAQYLLGIDNGATVAKAALFTLDGREVAVASRKTEMFSPAPGHFERDMEALWQATAEAIRCVVHDAKVSPSEIACVGCTGHGNGLYLVDAQGRPVRPAIISTDSRAKDYVARWYADGTVKAIRPSTMQSLWPGQPGPLLAWLRDHEPQSLRAARWALMCKDFIRLRLTGQAQGELTDMSGTSLLDVVRGQFDLDVLRALGLADLGDLLPPIRHSEEICGELTPGAAAETGLSAGTPVAGGMFDIDACALASGLVDERPWSLIAGTWGINQFISPAPVVDDDLFMCSRYCIPGYYLIPEASPTSASNLEWFVTQFFEAEAATRPAGKSVYDTVNELVDRTRPGEADIVFLPFLFGSNTAQDATACFLGLAGWHQRGHVLRAILEGVVFGHKTHAERLLRFRSPPETVRLTGGAARSRAWIQIFADVFQKPVEIPAGTELGALGAAIGAGVAAGCFGSYEEAVAAMVRMAGICSPEPAREGLYARKYELYRLAIESLGPLWARARI